MSATPADDEACSRAVLRMEYCIRRAISDLLEAAKESASGGSRCAWHADAAGKMLDVAEDLLGAIDKIEAAETGAGHDALGNALADLRALAFPKREIAARNVEEAMEHIVRLTCIAARKAADKRPAS